MKAICADCEFVIKRPWGYVCKARPLSDTPFSYVTGTPEPTWYAFCLRHNKDGECSLFEEKGQDGKGNHLQEDN